MRYVVVDTDVVSYLFKGDTRAEVYRRHLEGVTPAVSFMAVAELYHWAFSKKWGEARITRMEQALRNYVILPFDAGLCRRWARIQTDRAATGRPISTADAWVAACALRHGCPLVTNNPGDFVNIDGLTIISESPRSTG